MKIVQLLLLKIFALIALGHLAHAAPKFKVGQEFSLPTGDTVRVVGHVPPKTTVKNAEVGLMLQVEGPNAKIEKLVNVSDMFFGQFWGPRIDQEGKNTRATVYIEVPGAKHTRKMPIGEQSLGLIRHLDYERKEKGLWYPVGRPVPDWLKAKESKEIRLSDGAVFKLESFNVFQSQIMKSKMPILNFSTNWTTTGSRVPLEQIRLLASENLGKIRAKHDAIMVMALKGQKKDGFHFRPQVKAFILRKSDGDFWLVSKFQFAQFPSGELGSMIWYVPSVPYENLTSHQLEAEAKLLHEQFGAKIADDRNMKTSIVMAIWPAANSGERVSRYGTVFSKLPSGEWTFKPGKK